ncbi:MAG: DUF4837 family protein [Gemmatimonas sp.]|nr:DUF4837 family protein [Gemmatimonas sp.]
MDRSHISAGSPVSAIPARPVRLRNSRYRCSCLQHADDTPAAPVIRTITVASRPIGAVDWSANGAVEWRSELGHQYSLPPQVTETHPPALHGVRASGRVISVRGVWSNPEGEWPAAGPFVAQMMECPDGLYLADARLYAPATPKYDLVLQLEQMLGTFRCSAAADR